MSTRQGERTQRLRRVVIAGVLACVAAATSQRLWGQGAAPSVPLKVLFIGNSYTYFNNLGDIVRGVAAANPAGPALVPTMATRGGVSLKWHLENGPARQLLRSGGWTHVVLQEHSLLGGRIVDGKTMLGASTEFHASVREWVREIRAGGATPVLYMTWARRDSPGESLRVQTELAAAYHAIGRELDVAVAPVGLAWAEARRRWLTLDLHIWDGSHPTPAGSYLAGLVMYATLTGRRPELAPSVIRGRPIMQTGEAVQLEVITLDPTIEVPLVDVREATAAALAEVAWAVVTRDRSRPH